MTRRSRRTKRGKSKLIREEQAAEVVGEGGAEVVVVVVSGGVGVGVVEEVSR